MVFAIYSASGEALGLIEDYIEAEWTRRLYEPGEFELQCQCTPATLALLKDGNLIVRDRTDGDAGIIERLEYERDEEGATITAGGRLLSSVLDKRIIAQQQGFAGKAETVMLELIRQNCIDVADARKIPGMTVPNSQARGADIVEMEAYGKNLLDTVSDVAEDYGIGYRVKWPTWAVEIVQGTDRTAGQSTNARVVLSVEGETLLEMAYTHDAEGTSNVAVVCCDPGGDTEATSAFTEYVGDSTGLARREVYVKASADDAVVTVEYLPASQGGGQIVTTDYTAGAVNAGKKALQKAAVEDAIEGTAAGIGGLTLRADYDLGDKVTLRSTEWGVAQDAVITETTETYSAEGVETEIVFGRRSTIKKLMRG